ncbi:MAG TPA: stage II sporulation protein M [Candidatus Egerieimonas intestinavium]|uniref:Stage II sporulation protein M n=1 Tax=Candidatus Egerieimonas intestinavium TaxID=2840777 RepID=A0A9D1JG28_9FIRM|nr:stage II sporulation protein M [Candidatus Egerieimonas intestinavium]
MREQFLDSGRYVRGQWKKFLTVAGIFILLAAATAWAMVLHPDQAQEMMGILQENMGRVMDEEGNIQLFRLFVNNLSVAGLGVLMGFIPFLAAPLYIILTNGIVIGVVYGAYLTMADALTVPVWKIMLVGILPHGIFELGAIFLSVALGLQLCFQLSKKILGRANRSLKEELIDLGWAFVLWVTPMLLLAAVIECFLTPILMELLL